MKSGSTGGNKSLFVNSRASIGRSNSPDLVKQGSQKQGGFFAMTDASATADYKSMKKSQNLTRMLNNRSSAMKSAISVTRLEREFSPMRRRGSTQDMGKATEQLILELEKDAEEDDSELQATLKNEELPGTVKSQYALKFRLITDKDNANFMQVSIRCATHRYTLTLINYYLPNID